MFGFNSAHPGPFPGSPELDAATDGWRDHYHKGWAQRWLVQQLGQVECAHDYLRPGCECWRDREPADCCYQGKCSKCGAAV